MTVSEQKLQHALSALILSQPFYGALALSLPLKADATCKTLWTDARNIGYNPAYVESLSHDELVAGLAHEVSHVALGHCWRRDGREERDWNIACDKAVNPDLKDAGFKLPAGVLYASGDEVGKSAEWIFNRQGDKPQQGGNSPQQTPGTPGQSSSNSPQDGDGEPGDEDGGMGEVRDAPTTEGPDGEPVPTEADTQQKVAAAMRVAQSMGKMPGGMARAVAEALKPRTDIKPLLLRFFTERAAADYTWKRPNTRYVSAGLYLPALESKSMGRVGVMVDTSGSVDDTALSFARGILEDVIHECQPAGVDLVFADAAVKHVEHLEAGDPLKWEPQGGGGTDFRPALKYFEDAEEQVVCIVCITDLEGTFPDVPPDIPVLWLATEDHVAPFGETVPVEY